jgi:hypothetical protein
LTCDERGGDDGDDQDVIPGLAPIPSSSGNDGTKKQKKTVITYGFADNDYQTTLLSFP